MTPSRRGGPRAEATCRPRRTTSTRWRRCWCRAAASRTQCPRCRKPSSATRTPPTCGGSSRSGWSVPISRPRRSPPPGSAVQISPSDVQGHLTLAELYRTQKNWPEAEAELETVIKLNPDAEEPYLTLARYLVEQKAYDRARAVLLRLVERQPKNVQAQFLLGRLAIETESWDEAITRLEARGRARSRSRRRVDRARVRVRVAAPHRRGDRGLPQGREGQSGQPGVRRAAGRPADPPRPLTRMRRPRSRR